MNKGCTSLAEELQQYKDQLRESLLPYTRRAFHSLPRMPAPRILDIGCGSGVPTIELAKLSNGNITAIDTNQNQLDRLFQKVEKTKLSEKIIIFNCSMLEMNLPGASFDIVWAEGSISAIGFEKGVREWWYLLKPNGFLVIHDDLENLSTKRQKISFYNYDLIEYFILNQNIWWNNYYAPLEEKVKEMRRLYHSKQNLNALLEDDQRQIDGFHKDPDRYQSVFLVMRKME